MSRWRQHSESEERFQRCGEPPCMMVILDERPGLQGTAWLSFNKMNLSDLFFLLSMLENRRRSAVCNRSCA